MSRERLMAQQRARMEARRERLREQAKKAAKRQAYIDKYGSKGGNAVTRDTSKDKKKTKKSAYEQYFEGQKGKKGVTRPSGGASKKGLVYAPKPAEKKPAKPPVVSKPNKGKERFFAGAKGGKYDQSKERGKARFFAGGKGGKYDMGDPKNLKMSEHPGLKKNQKSKSPKLGSTKTVDGQYYYYDGSKWVKGRLGKRTRFQR